MYQIKYNLQRCTATAAKKISEELKTSNIKCEYERINFAEIDLSITFVGQPTPEQLIQVGVLIGTIATIY